MTLVEVFAIFGMASVTWLTRTLPFVFKSRNLIPEGFGHKFLENIPAAILAALISPKLVEGDVSIWISALITFAAVWIYRSALLGVIAGTLSCALIRWAIGA